MGVGPIVGGAIPELVVLGSIRKQVKQVMRNKPVSSTPSCFCITSCLQVPDLLEFLSWLPLMMNSDVEVRAE